MQRILEKPFTEQREKVEISQQQSVVIGKWVICLLIGCIALGFNLYRLGAPSIWFDEALSIERARQSLPVLWKIIFTTQPNMALYYLALHYWLSFTGLCGWLPTEFVVRFPSAIFAVLSTVMIYLLGRRFMGPRTGLVSAGLYIVNALQLTYAQETRSYSLQLLLVCCSWYALLTAQTDQRPQRWWIFYAITTSLAVYAQLFSVFIILAQVVTCCCLAVLFTSWREQIRNRYLPLIVSLAAVFVAILPILVASRHADKTGWLPAPQVSDIVHFLTAAAGGKKAYVWAMSLTCVLCVLSILLTRINRYRKFSCEEQFKKHKSIHKTIEQHMSVSLSTVIRCLDTERIECSIPVTLAMLCWFVIPLLVSFAISQGSMRLFSTRYLVIIVPPLLYLAALGIETLAQQSVRTSLIALLLVIATFSVPTYYQSAQVEDWKQTTFWLQSHQQVQDGIACYDNAQGCQLDIEYYLRAYPRGITFPTDSPGSFPWVSYDLTNRIKADPAQAVDPHALMVYSARHPRIFFVLARLPSNESIARAKNAQSWLDSHYQLVDQIVTRTVTIRLYQTTMTRTVNGH